MGVLTFFCLYSLKVERNTVNILVDVQFILKAIEMFNKKYLGKVCQVGTSSGLKDKVHVEELAARRE